MPRINISKIAGVKLYYERLSSEDKWGDLAENEEQKFYAEVGFIDKLEDTFNSLFQLVGYRPDGIISAGMYVNKPGAHGTGRAFDLDGIIWNRYHWTAFDWKFPDKVKAYLAVQAHFMLNFGNVLGNTFNRAHEDHLHIDDAILPGFRSNSISIVGFTQLALNTFWDANLLIDKEWGPKTRDAMKKIDRLSGDKYPTGSEWNEFLRVVRSHGLNVIRKSIASLMTSPPTQPLSITARLDRIERILKITGVDSND